MANNNILSFFRNAFLAPTRSTTPFGKLWTKNDPGYYMDKASRLPSPYGNTSGFKPRHTTQFPPLDGAELMNRAAALPSPYANAGASAQTTTATESYGDPGAGYSMPNLDPQAWAIVNAAIAKQKAANQSAREDALANFARMKQEYDLASQAQQGEISDTARDDRARLNNLMASRGIGAGEAAAMNFGRFDETTQKTLAQALAYYTAQTNAANENTGNRVSALDEQDRLLDEGAPAEAFKILQELQNNEVSRAQAIASMNESASGGSTTTEASQMWSGIGADAIAIVDGGLRGTTALNRLNALYAPMLGVNLEVAAQQGDARAQQILSLIGYRVTGSVNPPASGGYTNLATGQYTPPAGSTGSYDPRLYSPNPVTSIHR